MTCTGSVDDSSGLDLLQPDGSGSEYSCGRTGICIPKACVNAQSGNNE